MEQYCIDAASAVDLIYFAGVEFDDIREKVVFDLGSGTGRLSISCAYLMAQKVISVDIDRDALSIMLKNLRDLDLCHLIDPICADLYYFPLNTATLCSNLQITTIMNPPFGIQAKGADRIFLEKAFSFSDVVYSIHAPGNKVQNFLSRYAQKYGWEINYIIPYKMKLEKSYAFHKRKVKEIDINIYRFTKRKG